MAASTLCIFLIGCAHKNESASGQINAPSPKPAPPQSTGENNPRPALTYLSDSNNPALAWILKGDYQIVKRFYDLPKDVRISILPEPPKSAKLGQMAEPNQEFNVTDVVIDTLPMRRFIAGGFSESSAFVFYEHGGRGYNQPLVIVKRINGKTDILFFGYCREKVTSLEQLKLVIKNGGIKEEKDARYQSL
jgi:hypothetical protein